jgi:rare lipoprotein A
MRFLICCILLLLTNILSSQEFGLASYYSDNFHGLKTASGELYNKDALTTAHKSLPFGTMVKVTRLDNEKSVIVRVNDRGPFITGRVVDISKKAAEQLDLISIGETRVKVEVVGSGSTVAKGATPKGGAATPIAKTEKPSTYSDNSIPKKASTPVTTKTDTPKATATTATNVSKPSTEAKSTSTSNVKIAAPKMVTTYDKQGFYKVQLLAPEKKGFGVQVASYNNYENAMQKVVELQGKWFSDIFINIEKGSNNSNQYKVILGQYATQASAESYRKSLLTKHKLKGFVVDFSKF